MRRDVLEETERPIDGRDIDPEIGLLRGEGAQQRVEVRVPPLPKGFTLRERPSLSGPAAAEPSYYGVPTIKPPVWIWSIPLYFYVGGLAGAASILGAAADLRGRGRLESLAHRCHWVGAVGDAVSGALLIHDLGRPARFLNMLRVFRPTSPMSLGSWILAGSGAANGTAVLLAHQRGVLGAVGRAAGVAGGLLGTGLAGYTAVLLTNTSVPVWQHTHRTLPLLFMSSAMASCGAFLELLPHRRSERRVLRTVRMAGAAASLVAGVAVDREASRAAPVGKPLRQGVSGALWAAAGVCTVGGLALGLVPGRQRWTTVASSSLITAGALAMRFAMFHAGKASALDPQATFRSQREGLGAAEVRAPSEVLRREQPERFRLPVVH
jgi:formate-dependent nitrite reductase membrane component NrfD